MKREGWQHGMVRSSPKAANTFDDYTKAPLKPTNHSKYSGKCRKARCGQCHSHPVSKSRDKAKGSYKLKSCDVALNHRLVSWRVVVDKNVHWSKFSGISASGALGYLLSDQEDDDHEDNQVGEYYYGYGDPLTEPVVDLVAGCSDENEEHGGMEEESGVGASEEEEEEDGDMGFCEVGFVWRYLDGEDWCLVDEM